MIRTILLLAFSGTLLLLAVRSLRKHHLKEGYALLFFVLGLPFLGFAIWPDAIVWMERTLKIEKATLMVFALGTFTILLIFKLLTVISLQERRISALAQQVAILSETSKRDEDNAPS